MIERGGAEEQAGAGTLPRMMARAFMHIRFVPSAMLADWRERLHGWLLQECAPGRLMPWLPVAFATGIILYFSAEQEPVWWAGFILACGFAVISIALRASPIGFPIFVALTTLAAGFATASIRTAIVSHPVLVEPLFGAQISGFIEEREQRERNDRIVLRVRDMTAPRISVQPERVRLSVKKGTAPPVGSFVELRAQLNPPLAPVRPGGYDFARDLYFQQIGASGYAHGAIRTITPPQSPDFALRMTAAIDNMREVIDERIRAVLPGDRGAIASALITGKRDAISASVNEAMFVSSLGHVLSISGYHMAVVAGVVFFAFRACLALVPAFASRYPIKKWSAAAAFVAASFYLVLSGAEVATQRAYIMTAIVLIGVMLDRPALTLRTIAVAAFAILLLTPEAIVHPSFQMSFAATLALIAAYERGLPWFAAEPRSRIGTRFALWGGREILGLVIVSLVAGAATTLYAAYHFHRLAPYGLLANLLAMPIVSFWVMPAGMLGFILMPFGFDGIFWILMGHGVEWMMWVAEWTASLPGAVGQVHAFGVGPLLVASFGLIVVCLLRSPLRWSGFLLIGLAIMAAAQTKQPDILISQDARMVAVRNADLRFSLMKSGQDNFVLRQWLAADADPRGPRDASLSEGIKCDELGCTARMENGNVVALAKSADALFEDCSRAFLMVTARRAPPDCNALVFGRAFLRRHGATALTSTAKGLVASFARSPGHERPWSGLPARAAKAETTEASSSPTQNPAEDATADSDALEAED